VKGESALWVRSVCVYHSLIDHLLLMSLILCLVSTDNLSNNPPAQNPSRVFPPHLVSDPLSSLLAPLRASTGGGGLGLLGSGPSGMPPHMRTASLGSVGSLEPVNSPDLTQRWIDGHGIQPLSLSVVAPRPARCCHLLHLLSSAHPAVLVVYTHTCFRRTRVRARVLARPYTCRAVTARTH
jgi:hypothetical protein